MTWSFVRMIPFGSMMTPEPSDLAGRGSIPKKNVVEQGVVAAHGLLGRDVDDGGRDLLDDLDDVAAARGQGRGRAGSRADAEQAGDREKAQVLFSHGRENERAIEAIPRMWTRPSSSRVLAP